ncbi:MAG: amidohydrolase [Atopobiaceae bacterium]|nr:amidohydrolase [Atopobiaceae bacterium]
MAAQDSRTQRIGTVTRRAFVASSLSLALAACSEEAPQEEQGQEAGEEQGSGDEAVEGVAAADLVLYNGEIQTMRTDDEVVSAVAVKDGEIVFIGEDEAAQAFVGDTTSAIDLDGAYVLPGFIDGHNHGSEQQLQKLYTLYLKETAPDVDAYHEVMRQYVADNPDVEYVPGYGLNLNAFENASPTHEFIDEVMPDKVVWISDMSQHGCLVNQKAMDELGITKDTPDPEGGKIYRDADGNPTGYLSDCFGLTAPLDEHVSYPPDQVTNAFKTFMAEMNSYGLTAFQMAGGATEDTWQMVHDLEGTGELTMRVNAGPFIGFSLDEANEAIAMLDKAQELNSDWQNTTLIKALLDGVPEGVTAFLSEPYAPEAGMGDDYCGPSYTNQDALNDIAAAIDKAGYQLELHAMGDGAANMSLNAFEYAQQQNGKRDARHQIAHCTLMQDDDIQRMADLEVIGAVQPMWFYYDPFFSFMEETNFGPERFAKEYRIKTMLDAGVMMTGSVDYPITLEVRPLTGIQAGATQSSPFDGEEDSEEFLRNPAEAVSVLDMIKMYTVNGAKAMFMEDKIGSIEVGKKGDFVVLGQNLLNVDVKEIANTGILYTISDGRVIFMDSERRVDAVPIQ